MAEEIQVRFLVAARYQPFLYVWILFGLYFGQLTQRTVKTNYDTTYHFCDSSFGYISVISASISTINGSFDSTLFKYFISMDTTCYLNQKITFSIILALLIKTFIISLHLMVRKLLTVIDGKSQIIECVVFFFPLRPNQS